MPTVIDSLVVMLGLDTKQFKEGQKKNAEDLKKSEENANHAAKAIEASGRQAAAFFTKLRNEALMLFAVFTGANSIKQFTENVINSDASMSRMARQMDMSVEDLAAWSDAVYRAGGSVEGATGSFQGLSTQIQNFMSGKGSEIVPFFRRMGIEFMQDATHARPLADILMDMSKWAQGKDPAMVANMFKGMGLDQGTINLLLKGPDAVARMVAESRKINPTSKSAGDWAEKLQQDWRTLESQAIGFGRRIVDDFAPAIDKVATYISNLLKDNKAFIDEFIDKSVKALVESATQMWDFLSHLDWASIGKTAVQYADDIRHAIINLYDYIVDNWPEIKRQFEVFKTTLHEVWVKVDDVVQRFGGWGKVLADFVLLWGIAKFAPMIGALAAMVGLVTQLTAGTLVLSSRLALVALRFSPLLALLALTGPAGGEDKEFSDEKNKEFLKNRGAASPLARWLRRLVPEWAGGLGLQSLTQDESMSAAQQAFLDTLAKPESGGDYTIKQGGSHFDDFSQFPEGIGPGGTSTAAGRYQFISGTWHDIAGKLGLKDFSPESQDKAAWFLAASKYRDKTGGDLESDVKAGKFSEIAAALKEIWPSLPGGSQSHQTMDQFIGRFSKNLNTLGEQAPPRPAGDPGKPPSVPQNPVGDLSMGAKASPSAQTTNNTTNNTSTTDVRVGTLNVQTQATDLPTIAGGIVNSLKTQLANTGLN